MPDINQKIKSDTRSPQHTLSLTDRKQMSLCGVREVISFDTQTVELETALGRMIIDGNDLKIGTLDTDSGIVELTGTVSAITYRDGEDVGRPGLFKRMFGC